MCICNKDCTAHFCGVCVDGDYNKILLKKYPKLFESHSKDIIQIKLTEESFKGFDKLCNMIQTYTDFLIECKEEVGEDTDKSQPNIYRIKSKFNRLNIYINNADMFVQGMVRFAEATLQF